MFSKGGIIETFFYETMPYVYLTVGGSAVIKGMLSFHNDPWLAGVSIFCGAMLASAAGVIIKLRLTYRERLGYFMDLQDRRATDRRRGDRRGSERGDPDRRKGERRDDYEEWFEKRRRLENYDD